MKKRNYNYDILRILACFLVVVNHTISNVLSNPSNNINMFLSLIIFFLCKMAIPIFLMLTGALLLTKKQEFNLNYVKRIIRIILLLTGFSFIFYYSWFHDFNILRFGKLLVSKELVLPYWYLYMILGLYIILPFIEKMVSQFSKKDFLMFFLLGMFFNGLMPFIEMYGGIDINPRFQLPIIMYGIWWLVIGYWIEKNDLPKIKFSKIYGILLLVIPIMIATLINYLPYLETGKLKLVLDNSSLLTVSLPSLVIFYFIAKKVNSDKFNPKIKNLLASVSLSTLGIYVLHPFFLTRSVKLYNLLSEDINQLISIFIIQIILFIVCYTITLIFRKIPGVKELF